MLRLRSAALIVGLLLAPAGASAQSDETMLQIDDPEARLDAWLANEPDYSMAHLELALYMGAGAGVMGYGIAALADPGMLEGLPADEYPITRGVLPVGLLVEGVVLLASGLVSLALLTTDFDDARRRWRAVRGGPDAHDERLRIEGELRARADMGRMGRMLSIGSRSVVAAAALGALIGFSAGPFQDGDRLALGLMSGALALGSLLGIVFELAPSAAERAWASYEAGLAPRPQAQQVLVAPSIGPEGGGLSIAGTF